MKSTKFVNVIIWIVVGIGGLIYLGNKMMNEGHAPTLEQYIDNTSATTTANFTLTTNNTDIQLPTTTISFLGTSIQGITAFVASNDASRERGLSGVKVLDDKQGMLFIFPTPLIPLFWMKEMNFSLDMVWIDENKVVVDITTNISPETFPNTFSPRVPIVYILEINTGVAEKIGLKVGTKLNFDITQK